MADGDSSPENARRSRPGRPERASRDAPRPRRATRPAKPPRLAVDVVLPAGVRAPGLAAWLQGVAPASARGTMTVAVVSDARVRTLNRDYRGKNQNTDVLSFPADPLPPGVKRVTPAGAQAARFPPRELGDVVIALGVARRQAREAGHSLRTELRILSLHGLLHLVGYDHEQDDGQMARLERRLRRQGGLREGLIERAGPAPAHAARTRRR